jgi:hypothetical protein
MLRHGVIAALACVSGLIPAAAQPTLEIHGKAWAEVGRFMHVTDSLSVQVDGNRLQGMGAQFTALAGFNDHLEAAIGFGGMQVYHSLGNRQTELNTLGVFRNYITEARLTYYRGDREAPGLMFTVGNFRYTYNENVRNLGLYLLRGPVYPGFLQSGFGNIHVDETRGNIVGAHLQHAVGGFRHDLILSQERELPPTLDWSLAYVARYRRGPLEVGGGVNFYHLLPAVDGVTNLRRDDFPSLYQNDSIVMASGNYHPYDLRYIEVMPSGDTVFYTHQGIKVMAMFALDLKPLVGRASWMGENDLKLYGETAIIGVKDYGSVYDDILERIPVMIGFNIPTGGLLDLLALEVEWYGAKYRADYTKLGIHNSLYNRGVNPAIPNNQPPLPSPIPTSYADYGISPEGYTSDSTNVRGTAFDVQNMTSDDWKWSLLAEKTVANHVRFTAQVANDHFVPRPVRSVGIAEEGGMAEAFTRPRDWYFMFRVGYFF